ncbi:MAG: heavy metal translocating P-type ATPase [Lautropia sp.]
MTAPTCWHCNEPLPAGGGQRVMIGGVERPMCCTGCGAAARWIEQLGLGDYYRLRDRVPRDFGEPGPRGAAAAVSAFGAAAAGAAAGPSAAGGAAADTAALWSDAALQRHVVRRLPDGGHEVLLLVDGLRCAACVWLIERALGALPGVATVQVNATARRARIVFDADRTPLSQLLQTLVRAGYRPLPLERSALNDSRRRESRDALKRLLVAGFGAMQSMMYAIALYVGAVDAMDEAARGLFRWLGFLVATPVVLYAAQPFFSGAVRALRARRIGMDVPVALAIAAIYAASLFVALHGGAEVYFDSVSMFVFFLLCGRTVEMRARHHAGDLTDAIARLTPAVAHRRLADGTIERVAAADLAVGDLVHVAAGETVPADGNLQGAGCRVDESLLTGEAEPVMKRHGDPVIAGSLVLAGAADLRVARVAADTALAAIVALVTRAQAARPKLAQAGERLAGFFVARILVLTALTALVWGFVDPARAFDAALAVLVVSCPCAFALAVPAALTRTLAVLARQGTLVVNPDAIDALAGATHLLFDKTGTLTERRLDLRRTQVFRPGLDAGQALCAAAALARESRHPASQALVNALPSGTAVGVVTEFVATAGAGLEALLEGRRLRLGRADFALRGAAAPEGFDASVWLADEQGPLAAFDLGESLRAGAREAVAELQRLGFAIEIVSGDAASRVADVAARLGITRWSARQLPQDKLARLAALRAGGVRVVMVGDGVNDAPVLAGADVAVAMAGGADLAQAGSDIVLANENLGALAAAATLVRRTRIILRQNQRWAMAYNLCAVPLAALGLVPPWLAALGMSASSLGVVLNALRIGRVPAPRHRRDRPVPAVGVPT